MLSSSGSEVACRGSGMFVLLHDATCEYMYM